MDTSFAIVGAWPWFALGDEDAYVICTVFEDVSSD